MRQLEVQLEREFFHWVTYRALLQLMQEGVIRSEERTLTYGAPIRFFWHRSFRYYQRSVKAVMDLVEEYSRPIIGDALGLQEEALVAGGFARKRFLQLEKNARSYGGRRWDETEHDLDFIFERDGRVYGVEVKNSLAYMDHEELGIKIRICGKLGIRPVFVVRVLLKVWIKEIVDAGGFALLFETQMYPWGYKELARRVARELQLPVGCPVALADGTMERFVRWHERQM